MRRWLYTRRFGRRLLRRRLATTIRQGEQLLADHPELSTEDQGLTHAHLMFLRAELRRLS